MLAGIQFGRPVFFEKNTKQRQYHKSTTHSTPSQHRHTHKYIYIYILTHNKMNKNEEEKETEQRKKMREGGPIPRWDTVVQGMTGGNLFTFMISGLGLLCRCQETRKQEVGKWKEMCGEGGRRRRRKRRESYKDEQRLMMLMLQSTQQHTTR